MLVCRMKRSQYDNFVDGEVVKTGDTSLMRCCFSAVINEKFVLTLHFFTKVLNV